MTRLLPDPPSRSGHRLTKRELDAALRVLAALRRPHPASIVMSWDNDMQDALGGLQRAGYVERWSGYEGAPRKASAAFRADTLATTDLGIEYLDSIKSASSSPRVHATRKRKSAQQLDREVAQRLAASGQPRLAALFADPAATKVFAQEMRHELQKQQTSQKTAAALAARPFSVVRRARGRRDLFGRYATELEAQTQADRIGGWVEHEGRVVHGTAEEP